MLGDAALDEFGNIHQSNNSDPMHTYRDGEEREINVRIIMG